MADLLSTEGLRSALAGEFRAAIEAVVGQALSSADVPPAAGTGWGTEITASGVLDGRITVWVDEAGVAAIAKAMMGIDEAPEPAVAGDMLRELFAQAAAATALKEGYEGLRLAAGTPATGTVPDTGAGVAVLDGGDPLAVLTFAGSVRKTAAAAAPVAAAAAAAPAGRSGGAASPSDYPGNLLALLDIDLPLIVRFARTEMTLRALTQLGPGSMVDMGRSPDAPVQLLIGSQVIAEGEVVVVSGNYGVRITSLVSPADRLKAMEL